MREAVHRFPENEEPAASILIWSCAVVDDVCFLASLLAMMVLK